MEISKRRKEEKKINEVVTNVGSNTKDEKKINDEERNDQYICCPIRWPFVVIKSEMS